MALELKTQIKIEGSPEEVWKVLMDFESYPSWNPFIKSLKGIARVGEKLHVEIEGMKFKPKVLVFDPNKKFVWKGKFFMPGIFDGTHSFVLQDNGDGSTTFFHSEKFQGILVPYFKKKMLAETQAGFETMNQALKDRIEGK